MALRTWTSDYTRNSGRKPEDDIRGRNCHTSIRGIREWSLGKCDQEREYPTGKLESQRKHRVCMDHVTLKGNGRHKGTRCDESGNRDEWSRWSAKQLHAWNGEWP